MEMDGGSAFQSTLEIPLLSPRSLLSVRLLLLLRGQTSGQGEEEVTKRRRREENFTTERQERVKRRDELRSDEGVKVVDTNSSVYLGDSRGGGSPHK